MGFYTKKPDKTSGDGLALTEWNDVNNALAGHAGLTLATNPADKVGIGTTEPTQTLHVKSEDTIAHFESSSSQATLQLSNNEGTDKQVAFCNHSGGRASIQVSGVEDAFNVLANGNVGIGTTNPTEKLQVGGTVKATQFIGDGSQLTNLNVGPNGLTIGTTKLTSVLNVHGYIELKGYSNFGRILVHRDCMLLQLGKAKHGNKALIWDGGGNWRINSDMSLKVNIVNEKDILSRLLKLNVKNYNWRDNPDEKVKSIGFIAQDVKPLFPTLVGEMENPETKQTTMTLEYASFGVLAVGAIKELKQEHDERITALEHAVAALKKK